MIAATAAPVCVADFVTPPLLEVHVAIWLVIGRPLPAPIVNVTQRVPAEARAALTPVGAVGAPTITGVALAGSPAPRTFLTRTVHV